MDLLPVSQSSINLQPPLKIDDKTIKRAELDRVEEIMDVRCGVDLRFCRRFPHLVHYLFTIMTTWPSSRDQILILTCNVLLGFENERHPSRFIGRAKMAVSFMPVSTRNTGGAQP
jgi:hypothetical protein